MIDYCLLLKGDNIIDSGPKDIVLEKAKDLEAKRTTNRPSQVHSVFMKISIPTGR